MSTIPLDTIIRPLRTAALGSEIITHRVDAAATRWVTAGDHDRKPKRKSKTKRDKKSKRDTEHDDTTTHQKTRPPRAARSAIITIAPLLILAIAFRPHELAPLAACVSLYLLIILAWGYSPTAALIATYSSLATMRPTLMAIVALIWIPTAYVIGSRDTDDEERDEREETVEDPLISLLRHLIGDHYGTHLRDVVESLNQASTGRQFTAPEVRAALDQRGVPTRAKVRAPKGGIEGAPETVTRGVHRDDLPAAPKPSETHPEDHSQATPPETPADPVATVATSL